MSAGPPAHPVVPPKGDAALMQAALERIGAAGVDIVPLVFDRFFAVHPETRALFITLEAAAGRMVMETVEALVGLAEGAWWVETSVVNFVDLHRNYGAFTERHYSDWIDQVIAVLTESDHETSHGVAAAAWGRAAEALRQLIGDALASPIPG